METKEYAAAFQSLRQIYIHLTIPWTNIPRIVLLPQNGYAVSTRLLCFSIDNTFSSSKLLFPDLLKLYFGPVAIILIAFLKVWHFKACLIKFEVAVVLAC